MRAHEDNAVLNDAACWGTPVSTDPAVECGRPVRARVRPPLRTMCLAPLLCVLALALPAAAQVCEDAENLEDIQTCIDNAADGATIAIQGARGAGDVLDVATTKEYAGETLSITKSLTLIGEEEFRPDRILFRGTVDDEPVLEVSGEGVEVTLINLAFTGTGSGIRVLDGARVIINRCYLIDNPDDGVSVIGEDSSAVIANTSIVGSGRYGVYVSPSAGTVEIGQTTILDTGVTSIYAEGGETEVYASLIDASRGEDSPEDIFCSLAMRGDFYDPPSDAPTTGIASFIRMEDGGVEIGVSHSLDSVTGIQVRKLSDDSVVDFPGDSVFLVVTAEEFAAFNATEHVVEVLSPDGDIAAVIDCGCAFTLDESGIDPPSGSTATGTALFTGLPDGNVYVEVFHDVTGPTAVDIRDDVGNLVLDLSNSDPASGNTPATATITRAEFENLISAEHRLAVYSATFPDGAIGAEIVCPCEIRLTGGQVDPPNDSTAKGTLVFTHLDTGNVSIAVSHSVTDPTGVEIRDAADAVVFDLGNGNPATREITGAEFDALLAAPHFVFVNSVTYPEGEIAASLECMGLGEVEDPVDPGCNGSGLMAVDPATMDSYQNVVKNHCVAYGATVTIHDPEIDDDRTVRYGRGEWLGKLRLTLLSEDLTRDDLPEALSDLALLDFEREPRSEIPLEVGADEVRLGAALAWLDCVVFPDPAVLGDVVRAELILDALSFDGSVTAWLVPELGWRDLTGPEDADYRMLMDLEVWNAKRATASLRIDATYGWTDANPDLPIDGRARIYLFDETDGKWFGIDRNEAEVHPQALARSHFLIDTTPPLLDLQGTRGDARADSFVYSPSDIKRPPTTAPYLPYYFAWEPDITRTVYTPASEAELYPVESSTPDITRLPPRIFFNQNPCDGDLTLIVQATWRDFGPARRDGSGIWDVETAGFAPEMESLTVPSAPITPDNVALFTTDRSLPRWIPGGGFSAIENSGAPDNGNREEAGLVTVASNASSPKSLSATWTLVGLDYHNATGARFGNDWRTNIQFVGYDRAGNESPRLSPIEAWWVARAEAVITSPRYNGAPTREPAFSWGIAAYGERPGASPNCWPIVKFRVYGANQSVNDWRMVTSWDPLTDWSAWDRRRAIDRNSFISDITTLGQVLDGLNVANRYLMLVVVGADEAGNVQQHRVGNLVGNTAITLSDLCGLNTSEFPCFFNAPPFTECTISNGPCAEFAGACNGIDFDIWLNQGQETTLDTRIDARFWYNRVIGGTSETDIRRVNPDELDFGSSTRIPLVPLDLCEQRIEARFAIQTIAPTQTANIRWRLYEDGRLVANGEIENVPTGTTVFQIPQDIRVPVGDVNVVRPFLRARPCPPGTEDRLGDDGLGPPPDGPNRRKNVDYLFMASTYLDQGGVEIEDPSPAAIRFTVYIGEDGSGVGRGAEDLLRVEQPIKSFTRE